jgi:hypothetical protein
VIAEVLLFLAGAIVGLLLRRNEVVLDARSRAVELLIDLEVMVELWPTDLTPIDAAARGEDQEVRVLLHKLTHWLTVAGVDENRAYSLSEAADTVWRGYPRNQRLAYLPGIEVEDERDPYRHYIALTAPVTLLELTSNEWTRSGFATRRAIRAVNRALPEIYSFEEVEEQPN